jgi:hypothetical protein
VNVEITELRQLAKAVLEMLDAQQAYFAKRKRGLPAQDELEASKHFERAMKSRCQRLLDEKPAVASLFDEQNPKECA